MLKACKPQEVWYFEDKVYPSAECREFSTGHSDMAYIQHVPGNRETGAPTTGVYMYTVHVYTGEPQAHRGSGRGEAID